MDGDGVTLHACCLRPQSRGALRLASADPLVVKGSALFQSNSCNSCHGDNGIGSAAAPALTGVSTKYTEEQLLAILRKPNSTMSNGGMQAVTLNEADMGALTKYLRQLH